MLRFIPPNKTMANLRGKGLLLSTIEAEKQKQEKESNTFNNAHDGCEFS